MSRSYRLRIPSYSASETIWSCRQLSRSLQVLPHLAGDQAGISGGFGQHGFACKETIQIVGHFACGAVAVRGVLFESFEADILQIAWNASCTAGAAARAPLRGCERSSRATVSPRNGGSPVRFVEDGAQRKDIAARVQFGLPDACSGERYSGVPRPGRSGEPFVLARQSSARPKSSSFGSRLRANQDIAGFRSRWMIPWSVQEMGGKRRLWQQLGLLSNVEPRRGAGQRSTVRRIP